MHRSHEDLVVARPEGLYCPAGDFHIDPWQPVERAFITHAHGDHLREGHAHYVAAEPGGHVVLSRAGAVDLHTLPYGETLVRHGVNADWAGLLRAIAATGASRVIVTHGYVAPLVRYLAEQGLESEAFKTRFGDDEALAEPEGTGAPAASREAEGASPPP